MADPITDFFNVLFSYQVAGVPLPAILVFLVVIFMLLPKRKGETYRKVPLAKQVKSEMAEMFKTSEQNMGIGRKLMIGANKVGVILKMIDYNRGIKTLDDIAGENSFYAFKVCKSNPVSRGLAQLGIGVKYYLVDKKYCRETAQEIVISPYTQFSNFIDVMVFSEEGKDVIKDIAYKITLENTLESVANYIPKMESLEVSQARFAGKMDIMDKITEERMKRKVEDI